MKPTRWHADYPAVLPRAFNLIFIAGVFCVNVGADTNSVRLEEVVVTASRTSSSLPPVAVSTIDWAERRRFDPALTIDEPLRRIPGVFIQNSYNFAQDQRIAIRGFGTRAAFGVREIKVLVDGIPESSPDGQTQLDNLDLASVRRIEVLRGPASALYGNASGGVINILTDRVGGSPYLETRLTGGSFGFHRYQARTAGRLGQLDYQFNVNWSTIDGYRGHSRSENRFVSGKLRHPITAQSDLTLRVNYAHTPWSQDAGGLTRAEVDANRRQARARNVALDAGEEVSQGRLGFIYRNTLSAEHEIEIMQYSLFRDFNNKIPILPVAGDGIVEFDRLGVGGGVKYIWERPVNQLVAGVDAEYQTDDRQRYANLTGSRGALGLDQQETVRSVGPYLRNEYRATDQLSLIGGFRYDTVHFDADDRFLADGNDSGSRALDQFSWSVGAHCQVGTNLQVYANVATSFQTPTTTELANSTGGGGFNPAVNPQTALNYEIGTRARLTPRMNAELALFLLQIDDELIPFTSATGRDFFRNAGRSERKGIELSVELNLAPGLDWLTSYTAMDAHYREYVTAGGAFSGNREPGIPAHQLFTELSWRHDSGLFASVDLQWVDQFELNDANTAKNDAYALANARLGYTTKFGRGSLTPFVAVNNLLNQRYNGQTRLNAFGGRYFEPAPRLTVFGGVTWRWDF